jgi:predicted nucleic acid-binding protein
MTTHPLVVLDTNVLYPPVLRDTMLRCAKAGLFKPCWSLTILDELERNLLLRTDKTKSDVRRLFVAMANAFPDALIQGHERHIPFLRNDPKDRHVVAAAVQSRATAIVTFNVRDFFALPDGIEAMSPADFLIQLLRVHSDDVLSILQQQADQARKPPKTRTEVLQRLENMIKPFTDEVRKLPTERAGDGS